MASNGESSRQGHTYGPTTVYDSILHQGDNIYLSNEPRKIDCRDELLLKDPFIYRESLKSDKGDRASGTCEWIRENEIYRSWLDGDENCLWIYGGPGKGKTMLSIFLTEELERKQPKRERDQDTTLLYFFCTSGNENYNNAIAVLRGLAYQLLSTHRDISASVSPFFETPKHIENTLSSPETLWMVFKTLLQAPNLGTVYCILDGLDECDEKSIGILIKQFRDFCSPSEHTRPIAQNLKLAIVSRKLNGLEDFPQIRLDPDNDTRVNEDIKRFISTAMQELSRRPGYDAEFLRDIENILLRRSKGTFLWIGFVMKELFDTSTRMEAMEVLNALPQGLPAMYGRMLQQIKSSQRHIISAILKCVTIAPRPMTLEELNTSVSLLCNTPIDSIQIMRDRIASCGPILRISAGQDTCTCSLVHQSARDYLLREVDDNDPILEEFRIKGKEAHASLARICFACIDNSDFRHGPLDITDASVLKKSPLLGYAAKYWPEHARHANEKLDFSKTFFRKKDDAWIHWWRAYRDALGLPSHLILGSRPLHIASYLGIDSLVRKMLQANAWRISPKFQKYVNWRDVDDRTPLILAAREGYHSVVQLLLKNGADANVTSENTGAYTRTCWGRTALEAAAERGHLSVVHLLLDNGADARKLPDNGTALHQAAKNGHEAVVQLLLTFTKGADVNLATTREGDMYLYARTPLSIAAHNGNEAIVRLLLAHGADVNMKNHYGSTALTQAVSSSQEAMVQLLLLNGADFDIKDNSGVTALCYAIAKGHEATVQLLLTKCVDVSILEDREHFVPLSIAAHNSQEAMVRLFLANGADVNIKNSDGGTALHGAAKSGYEAIVQLLLDNGADFNIKDNDGVTALYYASKNGHDATVKLLLTKGADVNTNNSDGFTPLSLAADRGHIDTVCRLLENGADVTIKDSYGFTALHRAAQNGHEVIVMLLLRYGADVTIKDNIRGYTALSQAVDIGHEAIVRMLLADGADVNIQDDEGSTALGRAAGRGREAIVQLLLENGAEKKDDTFNKALAEAASSGHEAIVRLLLAYRAHTDIKHSMALIRAAERGHEHILGILLEYGADINARHLHHGIWYTALEMAAKRGHTTTVQFLLANGAWNVSTKDTEEPSRAALDWAVQKGHEDIVQLLLSKGVSRADLIKALGRAIWGGHKGVLQILKSRGKL